MEQLIKMVAEKTGISEEKARQAVGTVFEHVRSKLPAPIAAQIESALGCQPAAEGEPYAAKAEEESTSGIGGLMGKLTG